MIGSKCLALHLGIENPFGESWMPDGEPDKPEAHRTEEKAEEFLLVFHLPEDLAIGFGERLVLYYGSFGIICRLKRIIEPFACNSVGKSAGIANEDDIGDR